MMTNIKTEYASGRISRAGIDDLVEKDVCCTHPTILNFECVPCKTKELCKGTQEYMRQITKQALHFHKEFDFNVVPVEFLGKKPVKAWKK